MTFGKPTRANHDRMSAGQQHRRDREVRRKKMLVDPKSYELAEYFLSDGRLARPDEVQELAESIQACIEDFIAGITPWP